MEKNDIEHECFEILISIRTDNDTTMHSLNTTELYACSWKHCINAAGPINIEWCFRKEHSPA